MIHTNRGGDLRRALSTGATILGIAALLAAFAGFYVLLAQTRDTQVSPPRVIGNLWTISANSGTRIYYITREDRAQVRSYDVAGDYTYDHTYSIFTLRCRDAATGSSIAEAQVARLDTTSPDFQNYRAFRTLPDGPGILGPQADLLWLWNGGPEARNAQTLEIVWNPARLRTQIPNYDAVMPDDPKYAKVLSKLDALVIKGQDARFYGIDRANGRLQPLDDGELAAMSTQPPNTADGAFDHLNADGRSLQAATSVAALGTASLIADGLWCGLLTADEREKLKPDLGSLEDWDYHNWRGSVGETAKIAYRGRYQLDAERNYPRRRITLDLDSVVPMGTEQFISAAFLRRPNTQGAWFVGSRGESGRSAASTAPADDTNHASILVLFRKSLGDKHPWHLARLGVDGTMHWSRSTGLTELNQLSDGGGSIVLLGTADPEQPKGVRPEYMLHIDEDSGESTRLKLATNSVDKP